LQNVKLALQIALLETTMRKMKFIGALVAGLAFLATAAQTTAETFGVFHVVTERRDVIVMSGPFDQRAALDFGRALTAAPGARLLVLDSPGGIVNQGLLVAQLVHARGLATLIPEGAGCYSACAFAFLAGGERVVRGSLGVHQMTQGNGRVGDLEAAQTAVSDIIETLAAFDVDPRIFARMFRTPNARMDIFTADEIELLDIARSSSRGEPFVTDAVAAAYAIDPVQSVSTLRSRTREPTPGVERIGRSPTSAAGAPQTSRGAAAFYVGLDLSGGDLASLRAGSLSVCVDACLRRGQECRAFTFNTNPANGFDDCYLKGRGYLPGPYENAISGVRLASSEATPPVFRVAGSALHGGLLPGIDFPGHDLSRAPLSVESAEVCQRACMGNDRCAAFTFIERLGHCWLKGSVPQSRHRAGMVSGVKRNLEFVAHRVLEIE
jgi:hypothetical protein